MKLFLVRLLLVSCIEDAVIEMTLRSMKVELLSPIKRRFSSGTTIADRTRYAKVKLPDTINSFPNTIKFQKEYYRCIHNGQMKVCSLCYSSEHLFVPDHGMSDQEYDERTQSEKRERSSLQSKYR